MRTLLSLLVIATAAGPVLASGRPQVNGAPANGAPANGAPAAVPTAGPADVDVPECRRLFLTVAGDSPRPGPQHFSARAIGDLRAWMVTDRNLDPPSAIDVQFYTPNGHLYQSFTMAVQGALKAQPASETSGRFPRPRARLWRASASDRYLEGPKLPVGGTMISRSGLYGRWTAVGRTAGTDKSCRSRFVITP